MNNLEKSELVIAKILGLLMDWGLQRSDLKFEELGLERDFLPFFVTCIDWLEAEGIIRAANVQKMMDGDAYVIGPTLTAHGFALMGKKISVGQEVTTVGQAVKETVKETGYYNGFGDLAGGFVGGLLKSLGNG